MSCTLGGCGLSPTYTVRVENKCKEAVIARLERRPSMNNMIELDSARVKPDEMVVIGPVSAPPLERVYIVITNPDEMHALPDAHKISRGNWLVTITNGSMSNWGAYEISITKE